MTERTLTEQINACLPQTQCELCAYPGCAPYAKAIATEGAPINKCLPGQTHTLKALAKLTNQDPEPYLKDMMRLQKKATVAIIREEECIGCTKCIQACPVDAIIGSAKHMHTIVTDACTGCELCIAPCPTDCIDLIALANPTFSKEQSMRFQKRHEQHLQRVATEKKATHDRYLKAKQHTEHPQQSQAARKALIQAAINRKKGHPKP